MSKNRSPGVILVQEDIPETDIPEEVGNSVAESAQESADVTVPVSEEPDRLVYIGPTIFRTELISGRVFITDGRKINDLVGDDLRNYPLARTLFVTPEEAAAAMSRLHDPGTAIGNAYRSLSGR